jgi:small subunit ribosomal protein S17
MSKNRKRLTGVVTRADVPKTIMVQVDRAYRHQLYSKVIQTSKRYMVHDEIGCDPGDLVRIVESRPISKRKRWVVQEILRKATAAEISASEVETMDELPPEVEA